MELLNFKVKFVIIGRMEPVCDIVLQHPSVSRVHAVLQFDAQGAFLIYVYVNFDFNGYLVTLKVNCLYMIYEVCMEHI